jgi:hypothetical protein
MPANYSNLGINGARFELSTIRFPLPDKLFNMIFYSLQVVHILLMGCALR